MVKNNRQPAIWVGLGPEFHVNSGSGPVGSLHLWVGLSRVKKIGPTSNCDTKTSATSIARRITSSHKFHTAPQVVASQTSLLIPVSSYHHVYLSAAFVRDFLHPNWTVRVHCAYHWSYAHIPSSALTRDLVSIPLGPC